MFTFLSQFSSSSRKMSHYPRAFDDKLIVYISDEKHLFEQNYSFLRLPYGQCKNEYFVFFQQSLEPIPIHLWYV